MKGGLVLEVLFWAIMVVVFIIAEVMTVQLVSVWFAAGALVTLIMSYFFELSLIEQLGIFIIASTVFLMVSLPFLKKRRSKDYTGTNSELDVGKTATVIEDIDSVRGTGRVTLNGVDWSAVSDNTGSIIPAGSIVTVIRVQGAKLIVTQNHY